MKTTINTNKIYKTAVIGSILLFGVISGCSNFNKNTETVLFNGNDLSGWVEVNPATFVVEQGKINTTEIPGSLFYVGEEEKEPEFKNFEFSAEIKTDSRTTANIGFHTSATANKEKGYLVQILNTDNHDLNFRKTGSLLGIREVYKSVAPDNEWFTIKIIVAGKRIKVFVNDILTVDYIEPDKVTREPHFADRKLSSGTFAIHSLGKGVSIKNMSVKMLPDNVETETVTSYFTEEKQQQINTLIEKGYPIIDYHIHMKGGVTLEEILDKSRSTGIFCSVAPNCGIGFPVDTNEKLEDFYNEYKNVPIFLAMQAEGREWVNTFEKESIARFDYVFTDAMTFNDRNGNRMQIWKDEQVNITDPQDFMELLLETIEDVLDHEKIDIYVNATFLPSAIADRYEELWTNERMDRVVDALVRNDIALEISARYEIPGPALIKKAKERGVKFTFGTNNLDHDFANLDYCLAMIEECNLQPSDFFMPKAHGQKPVQTK
jgi:hypothetical protein